MERGDKVEWGMMRQSIESIKENQVKMDKKLDSMISYIDERFREQEDKLKTDIRDSEERARKNYAPKYVERMLLILIPIFVSSSLGVLMKAVGIV